MCVFVFYVHQWSSRIMSLGQLACARVASVAAAFAGAIRTSCVTSAAAVARSAHWSAPHALVRRRARVCAAASAGRGGHRLAGRRTGAAANRTSDRWPVSRSSRRGRFASIPAVADCAAAVRPQLCQRAAGATENRGMAPAAPAACLRRTRPDHCAAAAAATAWGAACACNPLASRRGRTDALAPPPWPVSAVVA